MYDSPIELFYQEYAGEVTEMTEDYIFKKVTSVGVNVDKEELIKALQYDRSQYTKGYNDAKKEYERPTGTWIVNVFDHKSVCSVCGTEMWYGVGESKFCPNCGARMEAKSEI